MLHVINKLLWGLGTTMLFACGLYFTYKLKFIQFKFKDMFKGFKKDNNDKKGISGLQALLMTLGARIGVGSIAGVALSIYIGGIGTIFWMWVSAIICSTNAFAESVLAIIYRKNDGNNLYVGGPSYYIESGLRKKVLSKIYALIIMFAYIAGFLTIQANTIVKSITEVSSINPLVIAFILVTITMLIIVNGVKSIASFSSKLVPFKSLSYILICLIIVIINIDKIPSIFISIINEAFSFKAAIGGFITTLIIGIQRGIFSNEAGIGSGSIAASVANTKIPTKQGLIQILGVYFTTLIICTLTALVIISSNYKELILSNVNGIEIAQHAFSYHIGNIGNFIVMIFIILFSFSTITTGYYYGEANLKFLLKKTNKLVLLLFKILVAFILLLGCILSPTIVWHVADTLIVLLAIINTYALLLLRKEVIKEYRYYKSGKYDIMNFR